ncbi:MAG: T9SS type A sorting domain-containing protein [Bacteroidales bacterium]|jgi:hypothetical protein
MKKSTSLSIIFLSLLLNSTNLIAQTNQPEGSIQKKTSVSKEITAMAIPFSEGWDQGSFELNGWSTDGTNWLINSHSGNPGPTAEFAWDPLLENSYFSALTSNLIDATLISEGDLFLDFDIQLTDRYSTAAEIMKVEVYNDSIWTTVATFSNTGSFTWESHHINISTYALEKTFQIRFAATGENSFDILSWFVDNIEVYRTCKSVSNVCASEYDLEDIRITWDAPFPQPVAEWLCYDDGYNFDAIGGPATFGWAIKFDPDQIAPYTGASLTKIRIYNRTAATDELRIYSDTNAATLLHTQTLSGLPVDAWSEVTLTSPIMIDVTKQLWITVFTTDGTNYPAACGSASGEPNGDLITTDGTTWEHLSEHGLMNTWNLGAFVATVTGVVASLPIEIPVDNFINNSSTTLAISGRGAGQNNLLIENEPADRSIIGFNIYRKLDWGDFELYQFVPAIDSVVAQSFMDTDVNFYYSNGYYYKITCVWEGPTDYCESVPGLSIGGEDYIGIYIAMDIHNYRADGVNLYPNPTNNKVNITSIVSMKEVILINYSGQEVYQLDIAGEEKIEINTSTLQPGIYLLRIKTVNGIVTKRVVINR